MTEENYNYRTSQTLLRNQFPGEGKLKIPIIPKFEAKAGDFDDLLLIGFDKTHLEDNNHLNRMVHFFLYDYRFERVWKNPDNDIEKLSRYRAVLSPDFSMYLEMAPVMQLYNVFRNRWCGAYWASKGMRVIPTVNWGDEATFDFCFQGIEKGCTVAVSTYMASEHDNRKDQKDWFMAGYNEMLRQIEPDRIICYNTPFPEMDGNIVYVDYDRSSWRYMSYERSLPKEDLDAYKIGSTTPASYDILAPYMVSKGGGSAYGGGYKPAKPADERFVGTPGEIKVSYAGDGSKIETHIGPDGLADMERHHTGRPNPEFHSNPHDHTINFDSPIPNKPNFGPPINYWDGAPEFMADSGGNMSSSVQTNSFDDNRFETISDFKWSMKCGGETTFEWDQTMYGIFRLDDRYCISLATGENARWYDTLDDLLEHYLGGRRLRDIITDVTVYFRAT